MVALPDVFVLWRLFPVMVAGRSSDLHGGEGTKVAFLPTSALQPEAFLAKGCNIFVSLALKVLGSTDLNSI